MERGENQVVPDSDCYVIQEHIGTKTVSSTWHFAPSTINTIPVEILTNIFRCFQPEAYFPIHDIPPLIDLINVCKHWRTVALNAPSLWSTIALENPRHFHITMVRQWLERSKTCPLTLSLTIHDHGVPGFGVMIVRAEMILSIFIQHLCRWRSISLHFTNFPIRSQSPLLDLPVSQTAAPLLEKVDICHSRSFTPEASVAFWGAVGGYPSVRHAVWTERLKDSKSYLPSVLPAPWANLTHFTSQFVVDNAFLKFLAGCPTLEILHIISLHQSISPLNPRPRICLSSLHTLSCSSSSVPLSQLLDHLEVPKLTSLTLNEWQCCSQWISMFERSACRLRNLSIRLHTSSEVDIRQLLLSPSLVHVERLKASRLCSADSILQTLTQEKGTTSLPSLQQLELYVGEFQDGLLSAMLKSRLWDSSCSLKKIFLYLGRSVCDGDTGTDIQFLRSLKVDDIDLQYSF